MLCGQWPKFLCRNANWLNALEGINLCLPHSLWLPHSLCLSHSLSCQWWWLTFGAVASLKYVTSHVRGWMFGLIIASGRWWDVHARQHRSPFSSHPPTSAGRLDSVEGRRCRIHEQAMRTSTRGKPIYWLIEGVEFVSSVRVWGDTLAVKALIAFLCPGASKKCFLLLTASLN